MEYRKFGNTGEELSVLGFGAMRLPLVDGKDNEIDYSKALPMVRYAIDHGVNYLDTAWPYHGGTSEAFCAEVMKEGYRDKVKIATKMPMWDVKKYEDYDSFISKQLERLQVENIDFYLMHALCEEYWETMKKTDYKSFLDRIKSEGLVKHVGFSYHADIDLFKEIIDDYDWDFCQIQLNYMDESYQAGLEGLKYAADKGMGVVIMEPLRGGTLSKKELPEPLKAIWDKADTKRTPAEWALRYLFDKEEVGVVLSGMTEQWQLEQNLKTASEGVAGCLTEKEQGLINEAKQFFMDHTVVDCTNCRYCMPCPVGVNIPENFWALNHDSQFNDPGKANFWINGWLNKEQRASNCIECGKCEEHCPQNIEIRKYLKVVTEKYEKA